MHFIIIHKTTLSRFRTMIQYLCCKNHPFHYIRTTALCNTSFCLTINAYTDISQPFSHTCNLRTKKTKKKILTYCCELVISLYMYMTYMHVLFILVHIVLADEHLFFKIKKVEGHLRGPASHLSLAEHK